MSNDIKIAKMEVQIIAISEKIDDWIENNEKDIVEIKSLLNNLDSKFASKWVEKISIGLITAVGIAVIGTVLSLILK